MTWNGTWGTLVFTEHLLSASSQDNCRHLWAIFSCRHPQKSSNLTLQIRLQWFSWRSFGWCYGDSLEALFRWQQGRIGRTLMTSLYRRTLVFVFKFYMSLRDQMAFLHAFQESTTRQLLDFLWTWPRIVRGLFILFPVPKSQGRPRLPPANGKWCVCITRK